MCGSKILFLLPADVFKGISQRLTTTQRPLVTRMRQDPVCSVQLPRRWLV